jgi:hypothetical protein
LYRYSSEEEYGEEDGDEKEIPEGEEDYAPGEDDSDDEDFAIRPNSGTKKRKARAAAASDDSDY